MLILKKCMHLTTLPKAFYHSSNFGPFFSSLKTNHLISVLLRTVGPLHYQIFFLFFASLWHLLCPNYFLTLSFPSLFTIHVVLFLLGFVTFFFSLALPVVNRVSGHIFQTASTGFWLFFILQNPALRSLRFAYSVASSFSFPSPCHSLHIFHFPYKVLFLLFWLQKPIDHSNSNVCFSWAHKRSYSYSLNLSGNFPIQMGNTCKQWGMSWS